MNRLIADFAAHRSALETARGAQRPINSVRLETPVPGRGGGNSAFEGFD
jgi:hypothetical protein